MNAAYHKRIGAALGCEVETEIVAVRCSCGWRQEETFESDAPMKKQLAETSCGRCGKRGDCRAERAA